MIGKLSLDGEIIRFMLLHKPSEKDDFPIKTPIVSMAAILLNSLTL